MPKPIAAATLAAVLSFAVAVSAQGVDPIGRIHPAAQPLTAVAAIAVPGFDRLALAQDDLQRRAQGLATRFAVPNVVDVTPASHGTWQDLGDGWSLWRLRVTAPDANHVNLGFDRFTLPATARLMVYSVDYTMVLRPFDAADHSPSGELWTPVVDGDQLVVELYVPTHQTGDVTLHLVHVGAGYRLFGAGATALGGDAAGACNVDVACPQAAPWAEQIRSVARITIGGFSLCSGCLINNTAQDGRALFLTADHCGAAANPASVVAYWNYERATCGSGSGSLSQFTSGAVLRATSGLSDFTLLELTGTIDPAYGVSFAGWNRTTASTVSPSATCIHHPDGDVKKISFENQAVVTTSYGGTSVPGNGRYIRVIDWDEGTTEGGSSGSPLFDVNQRVIGQLSGGGAACGNDASDWYGKFSASWTGGGTNASRLSNWLDPLGTGQTTLDTLAPAIAAAEMFGVGCYQTTGTFYEQFGAAQFDLGGTTTTTVGLSLVPIANGYRVENGPNAWFAPTSTALTMADDGLVTCTLPFSFTAPGGATTQVRMCGNGFVWLSASAIDNDYTPSIAELVSGARRFAPLWMDLNATAGGSCHYDVDPAGTAVYFTWLDVPAYNAGTVGNTFQLVLRQDQSVEYRYRSVANTPAGCLVGWTRGATAVPTERDLGGELPFTVTVDGDPLTFTPTNRPIQGTTQQIVLSNIVNPTGSFGMVLAGARVPGLELGFAGMPGCFLYQTADIFFWFLMPLSPWPWAVAIPLDPSLTGSQITCQGVTLTPGVNAFGALSANGVELTFGTL